MKRIIILLGVVWQAAVLLAQTPQEVQLLQKRLKSFAYATNVEEVNANEYNVSLSSGETFTLRCGNKKVAPFKSIDVKSGSIAVKPHKGKAFKISRIPDQAGALMALYKATGGDAWTKKNNWGTSDNGVANWSGITCNESGDVVRIRLANNNLQGKLPDVFYAFPNLRQLSVDKNQLTGVLPRSLAWLPDNCIIDIRRNRFSASTLYASRERLPIVAKNIRPYPQKPEHNNFRLFVDCDVDLNPSQGYHKDGECRLYQKATEGAGINIFVIGDGYDKAEHAVGGTVDYWLERAAEAIFDIEPMSKLRNLFNVYIIYAYSEEKGTGLFEDKRNPRFGSWQKNPTKSSAIRFNRREICNVCFNSLEAAGYKDDPTKHLYVNMAVNCTNVGLYHGMMYSRKIDGQEGRGLRVSINPTHPKSFNSLVWHEFCGHAYGSLKDEYTPRKNNPNKRYEKESFPGANIDTESDPEKVKWAQFIKDPRYAHERIGVYKGAWNCVNLYRATESSIMRKGGNSKERFNAPSRAEIYKKAMSMAYPGWEFDYEEFVKFDMGDKYYPLK